MAPMESQALPIKAEAPGESPLKTARARKSLDEVMYDYRMDMNVEIEAMIKKAFYQGGFFDHKGYCDHVKTPEGCRLPILADVSNGEHSYPAWEWGEGRKSKYWDPKKYEKQVKTELRYEMMKSLPKVLEPLHDGYFIQPRGGEIVAEVDFQEDSVTIGISTDFLIKDLARDEDYLFRGVEVKLDLPAGRVFRKLNSMIKNSSRPLSSKRVDGLDRVIIEDNGLVLQYYIRSMVADKNN